MTYYNENTEVLTASGPLKLKYLTTDYRLIYFKDGEFHLTRDFIVKKDERKLNTYRCGNGFICCDTDKPERISKFRSIKQEDGVTSDFVNVDYDRKTVIINKPLFFLYGFIFSGFFDGDKPSFIYDHYNNCWSSNIVVSRLLYQISKRFGEGGEVPGLDLPYFNLKRGVKSYSFRSDGFPRNEGDFAKAFLDVYHRANYIKSILKDAEVLSKGEGYNGPECIVVKRGRIAKIMSLLFTVGGSDSYVVLGRPYTNKYTGKREESLYRVYVPDVEDKEPKTCIEQQTVTTPCVGVTLPEDGDLVLFSEEVGGKRGDLTNISCMFGPVNTKE